MVFSLTKHNNMNVYQLKYQLVKINIIISSELYQQNKTYFDILFSDCKFYDLDKIHVNTDTYTFLISENSHIESQISNVGIININTNSVTWKFELFDTIELIITRILEKHGYLILHGGAAAFDNNAILFCGERESGKTTLINMIINQYKFEFVSDDLLVIDKLSISGINLPAKLRRLNNDYEFYKIIDDKYQNRYLCKYPSNDLDKSIIKKIVFPHYNKTTNSIEKINGIKAYNVLMNNVRGYENMKLLNECIRQLCLNCELFEIHYTSDEYVYNNILPILLDGIIPAYSVPSE